MGPSKAVKVMSYIPSWDYYSFSGPEIKGTLPFRNHTWYFGLRYNKQNGFEPSLHHYDSNKPVQKGPKRLLPMESFHPAVW